MEGAVAGIERFRGLWQAIVEAASSDEVVDAWRRELDERRRIDVRKSLERILGRGVDESTITMLWALYSVGVHRMLVLDGGMGRAGCEELLIDASRRVGRRLRREPAQVPPAGGPAARGAD